MAQHMALEAAAMVKSQIRSCPLDSNADKMSTEASIKSLPTARSFELVKPRPIKHGPLLRPRPQAEGDPHLSAESTCLVAY